MADKGILDGIGQAFADAFGPGGGAAIDPAKGPPKKKRAGIIADKGDAGPSIFGGHHLGQPVPNWCSPSAPIDAGIFVDKLAPNKVGWGIRNLFGYYDNGGNVTTIPDWVVYIWGWGPSWWGRFTMRFTFGLLTVADWGYSVIAPTRCNISKITPLMTKLGSLDIVSRWIGVDLSINRASIEATVNFACPWVYPSPAVAIAAYLHDEINLVECKGWAAANGWCEYYTELEISRLRVRQSPAEILDQYFRGRIPDKVALAARLRKVGVTNATELDDTIEGHYTRWNVGEIYRAMAVLRPGRVPPYLEYTEADGRRDLLQLGYHPSKIDQMIYLRRKDISHRFLMPPFKFGQIDSVEIKERLRDDSWNEKDIGMIYPYYQLEREINLGGLEGAPGPKELVKQLADGEITYEDFETEIARFGLIKDIGQNALGEARKQRIANRRKAGIANVKAGMKAGELNGAAALSALSSYGVPVDMAQEIVAIWSLEFNSQHKPASIPLLCDWTNKGLISVAEYRARLVALGWSMLDADRIMRQCGFKQLAAQQKLDDANAKKRAKAQADLDKVNRDVAKMRNGTKPICKDAKGRIISPKKALAIAAGVAGSQEDLETVIKAQLSAVASALSHIASRSKQAAKMAAKSEQADAPQEEQAIPDGQSALPPDDTDNELPIDDSTLNQPVENDGLEDSTNSPVLP